MNTKTGLRSGYPYPGPGGSYDDSCVSISYNPNSRILQAECEAYNGYLYSSAVTVPEVYEDIKNCNGILKINSCTGNEGVWES